MQYLLLILGLTMALSTTAQNQKLQIPDHINNTKTAKHINIKGTRLFIVPATGFTQIKGSSALGMEGDSSTGIIVFDSIGGNYDKLAASISPQILEENGYKVIDHKDFLLNNYPANLIWLNTRIGMKSYILEFGDTSFSLMLTCVYHSADTSTERQLKEAILGITYDVNLNQDPYENSIFRLDDSKSKFKLKMSSATVFMFSPNETKEEANTSNPFLMTTTFTAEGKSPAKIYEETFSSIDQSSKDTEFASKKSVKVNGNDAYEVVSYKNLRGIKTLQYMLIVANKDNGVAMIGTAQSDLEDNLKEFRILTDTFLFQ